MQNESNAVNYEVSNLESPDFVYSAIKPDPVPVTELYGSSLDNDPDILQSDTIDSGWMNSRIGKAAVIGLTVGALAFEQSPANESVRATVAFNVLELDQDVIDNDQTELLAASLAVGGMTVAIEGITATVLAYGLNQHSDTLKRYTKRFTKKLEDVKDPEQPDDNTDKRNGLAKRVGGALTDTGITSTIGPGMVVFRRHLQETERSFKKDVKTGLGYTAVGAAISTGIAYLVLGGVEQAEKIGLKEPAEFFADNATDWKFWTTLLVGGYGAKWLVGKAKQGVRKMFRRDDEASTDTNQTVQ